MVKIHPTSEVLTNNIGDNTTIWQFCVILPDTKIGENCNICSHVYIEDNVHIGSNVTIKNGVLIYEGVVIENNVFIGPNVTFTNDIYPRSKNRSFKLKKTIVREGASIGANSTILAGIVIGEYAMIGAGSVLTKSVGKQELWYGNPAKFRGYVCKCGEICDESLICEKCKRESYK